MYKFDYRSARFPTDLQVTFTDSCNQVSGTCTQISRGGMEVYLADGQSLEDRGRISVRHKKHTLELEVRVAHVTQNRCGMKFLYKTDREKKGIERLIADLSSFMEKSSL